METNQNGDIFPEISTETLSEMFMNQEARAQATVCDAVFGAGDIEDAFQIEFSEEPQRTVPNEAVRFQIGKESPPPISMMHRDITPTDGRVVSVRNEKGQFRTVNDPSEKLSSDHVVREITKTRPTIPRPYAPTALERIMRDDPLSVRPITARTTFPIGRQDRSSSPTDLERIMRDDLLED